MVSYEWADPMLLKVWTNGRIGWMSEDGQLVSNDIPPDLIEELARLAALTREQAERIEALEAQIQEMANR